MKLFIRFQLIGVSAFFLPLFIMLLFFKEPFFAVHHVEEVLLVLFAHVTVRVGSKSGSTNISGAEH